MQRPTPVAWPRYQHHPIYRQSLIGYPEQSVVGLVLDEYGDSVALCPGAGSPRRVHEPPLFGYFVRSSFLSLPYILRIVAEVFCMTERDMSDFVRDRETDMLLRCV